MPAAAARPVLAQDPTWRLESECIQQLGCRGRLALSELRCGKRLPEYLAREGEREAHTFQRFVKERQHLFSVEGEGDSLLVKAVPGQHAATLPRHASSARWWRRTYEPLPATILFAPATPAGAEGFLRLKHAVLDLLAGCPTHRRKAR